MTGSIGHLIVQLAPPWDLYRARRAAAEPSTHKTHVAHVHVQRHGAPSCSHMYMSDCKRRAMSCQSACSRVGSRSCHVCASATVESQIWIELKGDHNIQLPTAHERPHGRHYQHQQPAHVQRTHQGNVPGRQADRHAEQARTVATINIDDNSWICTL